MSAEINLVDSIEIIPAAQPPKKQPKVSICIANFNGIDYIDQCITSVLTQEFNFEFEIILHDDASTDKSVAWIRKTYPEITIITSRENVGFCVSNNRMAEYSRGEFLLFLNNDAALRPGSLNAFLKRANQQQLPGIIGLPQYDLGNKKLVDRGYRLDFFMNPVPIINHDLRTTNFVTGACLWLPKVLWNKIGGFPPWFESVAEDTYLCCSARLLGYPVEVLPEPGFDHWIGQNLGGGKVEDKKLSTTFNRRCLSERNKTFTMLICSPLYPLLIIFPLHLILLTIEGLTLSIIKWDFRIWNKIYSGILFSILKHRKELYRQRKLIMSQRKAPLKDYFSGTAIIPQKIIMLLKYGLPKIR